ncbi:hypothetical protein KCG44_09195 [Pacificimonas sp. WHA3]|uniref:YscD/Y4YQ C-terminal domain-containing protein n=1 Tax=Pacificimonas pallii TaxID=2827236 RepID=A0ABS6SF43_9SPHN|nr:hypothetical protein [Pacificimonas pallii]MBV7256956.1 hypothetical protein [Pacificimonas pallii]
MSMQLRVTAGPFEGAIRDLPRTGPAFAGYGVRNDIVLREPSARDIRFSLERQTDGIRLNLISGTIILHGTEIEAPRDMLLPELTPLGVGANILAIGEADDPRWAGCERLSDALARRGDSQTTIDDPWAGVHGWLRAGYRDFAKRSALTFIGAGLFLGGTAVATASGDLDFGTFGRDNSIPRLEIALEDNGFSGLTVRENVEGEIVVSGFVAADAQLSRVASIIESANVAAMTDIQTGERLARRVADAMRINGVMAETAYRGSGVVEAKEFEARRGTLNDIRQAVIKDVPALEKLILTPARLIDAPAAVMPHDPGKRVATVVGGEDGYVVTEDGSRYFAGAVLPTGDQLVRIDTDAMLIERGGVRQTVQF